MRVGMSFLNHRAKDVWAILFLCSLVLIFFQAVFIDGKTFYAFDCLGKYLPWSPFFSDGFRPNNTLITDPIHALYFSLFYPAHLIFQNTILSGSLDLWYPFNFCGVPFTYYSNPLLYLFFSLFSITTAHDLILLFHLTGTGIFTYLYLREIGLARLSSVIGAISWMLNGHIMVWLEFEHLPMMAFTLSLTLFLFEKWWQRKSVCIFVFMICSISLAISTFYAHVLIYQLLFLFVYIVFRFFVVLRKTQCIKKTFNKILLGPLAAMIISLIVSANFFTSHITVLSDNQREPFEYQELFKRTGQVLPKYLVTLLFPDFYGSPRLDISFVPKNYNSQIYNNYNELCLYPGIIGFFLALSCIPFMGSRKYGGFYGIVSAICLTMAMGSLMYYPLAKFVPGLNLSTPTRILYIFGFSISMMAGIGADIIIKENDKKKWLILIWGLLAISAVGLFLFVQTETGARWALGSWLQKGAHIPEKVREHFSYNSPILFHPVLMSLSTFFLLFSMLYINDDKKKIMLCCFLAIVLSYDLLNYGNNYNTVSPKRYEYPTTPAIDYLKKDRTKYRIMTVGPFFHQGFLPFGIEDIGGYGSFFPKRYGEYIHLSQKGPKSPVPDRISRWIVFNRIGSPLLDIINTKYILAPSNWEINSSFLKLVYRGEISIYENLRAFPRIFFVSDYYLASDQKDAYKLLGNLTYEDFQSKAIIEGELPYNFVKDKSYTPKHKEVIRIKNYRSDKIELTVRTERDGLIIIGDNYHRGWKGYVDGSPVNILRANYIMKAIPVEKGTHKIDLIFMPKVLFFGFITTIICWGFLIILLGYFGMKHLVGFFIRAHKKG
jgi:hypothetical protein